MAADGLTGWTVAGWWVLVIGLPPDSVYYQWLKENMHEYINALIHGFLRELQSKIKISQF